MPSTCTISPSRSFASTPGKLTTAGISGLGVQRIRWADSFCALLAKRRFHVIRFDNRDTGESTHFGGVPAPDLGYLVSELSAGRIPRVPYSLHDLAADAMSLLDALQIEQAHVVGRSMGGMVAQLCAATYPQRVLSLTAIMSSTGHPGLPGPAPDVMSLLMGPTPDPLVDVDAYVSHNMAFARRIASSGFPFDEASHRELILAELRNGNSPGVIPKQISAMAVTGSLRPFLGKVAVPTLVVHGSEDVMIPPACGRDIADHVSDAKFVLIDGMGHDVPVGLHEQLIESIEANARRSPA